jgi:hypothetical protein
MERLDRAASVSGLDREHVVYLNNRKRQIAKAMPVCEYIERKRELARLADHAGHDAAVAYRAVAAQLKQDHVYPDGLESACDQALLGRPSTPEAEAIVKRHRGR